ncbi:TPM domain-containing protein [Limnobacter sp.]|uniref:TPM domain-containing protein n=1 Tax=Limnobacter sp. TaxID=2003368 RepID=UPI00351874D8
MSKAFSPSCLQAVEHSIASSEQQHTGEIQFAVESSLALNALLAKQTPRERALEVFSHLRVWDTELNNGVLVYVLLADHAIEIVADRGIHRAVGPQAWQALCEAVQSEFAKRHYTEGCQLAIQAITHLLVQHFPCQQGGGPNELPNTPVVLG